MKKIRVILAAAAMSLIMLLSSCETTVNGSSDTDLGDNNRTVYVYSMSGIPLDTIYDVTRYYGRIDQNFIILTASGERINIGNVAVVIK